MSFGSRMIRLQAHMDRANYHMLGINRAKRCLAVMGVGPYVSPHTREEILAGLLRK